MKLFGILGTLSILILATSLSFGQQAPQATDPGYGARPAYKIGTLAEMRGPSTGGGGLGVETPLSSNLLLWDIFLNDPSFNDSQRGEQLQQVSGSRLGEWVDYRNFRSFGFLKTRLAKWQGKAKNLVTLINQMNFAEINKPNLYRLLLIQTSLFIKSIDEINVPDFMQTSNIKAYPVAYYENSTARVFLNENNWNRLGLVSQAGILLHERMRDLQVTYFLNNTELQKLVYMLLTQDPETTEFDDSRFSQSWLALHPVAGDNIGDAMGRAVGQGLNIYFRSQMFECINNGDSPSCFQNLAAQAGKPNFPGIAPSRLLGADEDIAKAEAKGLLISQDPGPLPLVSKGAKNVAPTDVPTGGPFEKMYGSYTVTSCKNRLAATGDLSPCSYENLKILPTPGNANAFLMSFTRDMNPGIRFFQSFYDKNGLGVTYSESGDQWASFNQVYVNPAFPTFNSSSEVSIKKNADGSFTLHTKHIFPTVGKEGSAATSGNFDCTISLQKN